MQEKRWERINKRVSEMDFIEDEAAAPTQPRPQRKGIEERFAKAAEQMNELSKIVSLKTERIAIKLKMMEERQQNFVEDVQQKLASLTMKANDKPRIEFKVQELIEKHNQVVRTFENRLSQLKRIVENQEVELYKAMNELSEARKELARLKKY